MNDGDLNIDSEESYRDAVASIIDAAGREIRVFDRNLLAMGLEDRATLERLRHFLAGGRGRRLRIVLQDTGPLEQRCPRLIDLLRSHSHLVEVKRSPEHLAHLADCWLLADGCHGAIRFHADQARGKRVLDGAADIQPWWRRFDELWEAGETCTPWSVAGL